MLNYSLQKCVVRFKENQLSVKPILQEPLIVALPETHALANYSHVSIRELIDEPFILPPHHLGAGLYSQIADFFERINVYPKVTQSATLLQTAISLVAGGVGVALVPASLRNLQRTGVIYKDITEPTPEIKIGVVWRSQDSSPILQQFLTVV